MKNATSSFLRVSPAVWTVKSERNEKSISSHLHKAKNVSPHWFQPPANFSGKAREKLRQIWFIASTKRTHALASLASDIWQMKACHIQCCSLYERFLGRPFAGHRDSVSELVGAAMENAVEERLRRARISFRKTGRAERVEGFDQAPDFIIPDEWNPKVVIEAKITEDDGTARDKVTRIQHLAEIGRQRRQGGKPGFQVIACIDGRGFGVRRTDMQKLLEATQGKVFTLQTLDHLVENTALKRFKSR
jgi:hypothetical protein